jgi:hypothetical protein
MCQILSSEISHADLFVMLEWNKEMSFRGYSDILQNLSSSYLGIWATWHGHYHSLNVAIICSPWHSMTLHYSSLQLLIAVHSSICKGSQELDINGSQHDMVIIIVICNYLCFWEFSAWPIVCKPQLKKTLCTQKLMVHSLEINKIWYEMNMMNWPKNSSIGAREWMAK